MTDCKTFDNYIAPIESQNIILSNRTFFYCMDAPEQEESGRRFQMVEWQAVNRCGVVQGAYEAWLRRCSEEWEKDKDAFYSSTQPSAPVSLIDPSDVSPQPVDWLIPGVIPRGELSLLGADGGTGKGVVQASMIADLTRGRASQFFGSGSAPERPCNVVIFAGEDSIERVLIPRLMAAGADLSRVRVMDQETYFNATGKQLDMTSDDFRRFIKECAPPADLILTDPLQAFIPPEVDMVKRNEMRGTTIPFNTVCREINAAGMIIMHANKKSNVSGRQRLADSSDLWDMARSVLMMGVSKTDKQIYLSNEKNSYAQQAQTAMLKIEGVTLEGTGIRTARAVFQGFTDKKDADFAFEKFAGRPAPMKEDVKAAIMYALEESKLASLPSDQLFNIVKNETGCSERTYKNARKELADEKKLFTKQIPQKTGGSKWFTMMYGEEPPLPG